MVMRLRRQDGQAMVEFALILPLFVALVFIVIGFGITLNNYLRVTDVARVAARQASIARFSGGDPCTAAITAATSAADNLTLSQPPTCTTPNQPPKTGDPITVSVTVDSQNAIDDIPFISVLLPKTLTGTATVLAQ